MDSEPPSDGIVSKALREKTSVSRDDLVLAVVPIALAVAWVAGRYSSLPLHTAMSVGGLVAAAAVVDALFVDPPGGGGYSPRRGAGG